jgi:hypothetical protein
MLAPTAFVPKRHRLFYTCLASISAFTVFLSIYSLRANQLTVAESKIIPGAIGSLLLLSGAAFFRWRHVPAFVDFFIVGFWAIVLSNLHVFPMFIAGRQKVEFSDALLAKLDRYLGLEVPQVLAVMQSHPGAKLFLELCYCSLLPMMALTIILLPLAGKMRPIKVLFVSILLASFISIAFFSVFQAVGPWYYYGFSPSDEQEQITKILIALKSEAVFHMDDHNTPGIITFPSFHTVLAIQCAIALWSVPYLRWFTALLAALIVVSTVTTGWHYVADVWAALIVVLFSNAAAQGFRWLEEKVEPLNGSIGPHSAP